MCFNSRTATVTGLAAALLFLSPSVRADGANAKDATILGKPTISVLPQSSLRIADSDISNVPATTSEELRFTESDLGLSVQTYDHAGLQMAVDRFVGRHPAIGDASNGNMLLAVETDNNYGSIEWWGTADAGASWVLSAFWYYEQTYPSIDYWGSGIRFHASFNPVGAVAPDRVYWMDIDDPMNASGWVVHSPAWTTLSTILYTDIACNNSLEPARFGIIGLVADYNGRAAVPCMVYQNSDCSNYRLSYFTAIDGCRSVSADIDPVALKTYVAYEWFDAAVGSCNLLVRRDSYNDLGNSGVGYTWNGCGSSHIQEPSVAANNNTVVLVFQFQDDNWTDPADRDIGCWSFANGIENGYTPSWIATTGLSERHPQVVHLRDNTFLCSFIAEDTLFMCESVDGGLTWSAPQRISASNDLLVDQYRTVDLMNPAGAAAYEFVVEGDSTTYVRVSSSICTDADGDLVCDQADNCDARYNPNQEDIDSDGIGDSCDAISIALEADTLFGAPPFAVSFTDLSFGISPITEWYWDFGDQSTSSDQNPMHTYTAEGVYDVTHIVSDGVNADTLTVSNMIFVHNLAFDIQPQFSSSCYQIKTADLDLDNSLDLVLSTFDPLDGIKVSFGNGKGAFSFPSTYLNPNSSGYTIAIGYVNSDTLPDILARELLDHESRLYVLLNNGNRTFNTSWVSVPHWEEVQAIAPGYFNADSYLDVAVSPSTVLYGDGTGTFPSSYSLPTSTVSAANVCDLNADGYDDLITFNRASLRFLANNGDGTFHESAALVIHANDAMAVATNRGLADFDRDGHADCSIMAPSSGPGTSTLYVIFGDGTGGIDEYLTIEFAGVAYVVVNADVNRDNILDLVISATSSHELQIFLGDGARGFSDPIPFPWTVSVPLALETGDFDRDGNPDFVTGGLMGGNIETAINLLPNAPVLVSGDEMRAIGHDGLQVGIVNPDSFAISRDFRTVAGCDYLRFDADRNGTVDNETIDYNLQLGEYKLTGTPVPGTPGGGVYNMCIGIDGSANRVLALNYALPDRARYRAAGTPEDTFTFYFEVEETSSIQPPNGLATPNNQPTFDWSVRAINDTVTPPYRFQMHRYHDFSVPPFMYDVGGLTSPQFTPGSPLQPDSVYYWRFLSSSDNGLTYQDTSRTFAAYIGCCTGRAGDANGSNEPTDEVTLGDIMLMVDAKFISGDCSILPCIAEADVNQDGGATPNCDDHVTLGDIMKLVDFLFITGPENATLPACL